ncbi:hypothetical protein AB1Y20_010690 [Prymnesium parvum]|uniref:Nucleotide-diphospho-sugar transferase domain-containing protein n=1 Tax=Prymnesium parvum TaxID=97485 RepID=A0AB34IS80_PRYPA
MGTSLTPHLDAPLLARLPEAQQYASDCFRAPPPTGCGAVYLVTGRTSAQLPGLPTFFATLANRSATSLKQWLPSARASLVLSYDAAAPALPHCVTSAFDEVVRLPRPAHVPAHRAWLEKAFLLAAGQRLYGKAVFFDADTEIMHADVAYLFAWLHVDRYSFMAVPEVSTSRSRRALRGHPIFNTGMLALNTRDPLVQTLLRRWQESTAQSSAALRSTDVLRRMLDAGDFHPFNLTRGEAEVVLPNDQFGLARQLTLTHAIPEVRHLSRVALPPRFNFRGKYGHGDVAEVVVNHDSRRKEEDLRKNLRKIYNLPPLRVIRNGVATQSQIRRVRKATIPLGSHVPALSRNPDLRGHSRRHRRLHIVGSE